MREWPIADLRSFLSGRWRIDRTITDRLRSISGKLIGEGCFLPDGHNLLYREHGKLSFGAYQGSPEQSYRYEFRDGPARARVSFFDGRAFHDLDLSDGRAAVSHVCGPDIYHGCFVAMGDDYWQSAWEVAGPRKDQSIHTHYARIG